MIIQLVCLLAWPGSSTNLRATLTHTHGSHSFHTRLITHSRCCVHGILVVRHSQAMFAVSSSSRSQVTTCQSFVPRNVPPPHATRDREERERENQIRA